MGKVGEKFQFTSAEVQANFSAILSVITEQEALIAELIAILVGKGILKSLELTKITDVFLCHETLPLIYRDIYKRYSIHFLQAKQALEEMQTASKELEDERDA
jgi:hypothetical protein